MLGVSNLRPRWSQLAPLTGFEQYAVAGIRAHMDLRVCPDSSSVLPRYPPRIFPFTITSCNQNFILRSNIDV